MRWKVTSSASWRHGKLENKTVCIIKTTNSNRDSLVQIVCHVKIVCCQVSASVYKVYKKHLHIIIKHNKFSWNPIPACFWIELNESHPRSARYCGFWPACNQEVSGSNPVLAMNLFALFQVLLKHCWINHISSCMFFLHKDI